MGGKDVAEARFNNRRAFEMSRNRWKNRTKLDERGPRCPRCGIHMAVFQHAKIGEKQVKQRYYYSKWFRCFNRKCKTTIVHQDRFRIYPNRVADNELSKQKWDIRDYNLPPWQEEPAQGSEIIDETDPLT
jgi:hypothetical protein